MVTAAAVVCNMLQWLLQWLLLLLLLLLFCMSLTIE
jgi:hypothetical protein